MSHHVLEDSKDKTASSRQEGKSTIGKLFIGVEVFGLIFGAMFIGWKYRNIFQLNWVWPVAAGLGLVILGAIFRPRKDERESYQIIKDRQEKDQRRLQRLKSKPNWYDFRRRWNDWRVPKAKPVLVSVTSKDEEEVISGVIRIGLNDIWIMVGLVIVLGLLIGWLLISNNFLPYHLVYLMLILLSGGLIWLLASTKVPIEEGYWYLAYRWNAKLGFIDTDEEKYLHPLKGVNKVIKLPVEGEWVDVIIPLIDDGVTAVKLTARIFFTYDPNKIWKLPEILMKELSVKLHFFILDRLSITDLEVFYSALEKGTVGLVNEIRPFLEDKCRGTGYGVKDITLSSLKTLLVDSKHQLIGPREKAPYENWLMLVPVVALCASVFNPRDWAYFNMLWIPSFLFLKWLYFSVDDTEIVAIYSKGLKYVVQPGRYLRWPWQQVRSYGWHEIKGKDGVVFSFRPLGEYLVDALAVIDQFISSARECNTLLGVNTLKGANFFELRKVKAEAKKGGKYA
jgi:hypothetical protein